MYTCARSSTRVSYTTDTMHAWAARHAWDHGICYKWPNSTDFRKSAKQELSSSRHRQPNSAKFLLKCRWRFWRAKSASWNLASSDESSFSLNRTSIIRPRRTDWLYVGNSYCTVPYELAVVTDILTCPEVLSVQSICPPPA
jgi:hypothetical protein